MNESQFRDLTRKAMIREYLTLKNNTITLVDACNDLYGFIERNFEMDDDLQEKLEAYDVLVDQILK